MTNKDKIEVPNHTETEVTMSEPVNDEIDKKPRAVKNGMSQAEYDTWMFLVDKLTVNEPYTYAIKQSDLTAFITSQTKKAELKGRIDGLNYAIKTSNHRDFVPVWMINELINQPQSERNKLEGKL